MQLKNYDVKFFWLGSAGSNIFRLRLNWNSARLRLKRSSAELLRLRLWCPGLSCSEYDVLNINWGHLFIRYQNEQSQVVTVLVHLNSMLPNRWRSTDWLTELLAASSRRQQLPQSVELDACGADAASVSVTGRWVQHMHNKIQKCFLLGWIITFVVDIKMNI